MNFEITEQKQEGKEGKEKKRRGAPLKHLWKPGQSGNPKGRPKGSKNFSTLFRIAAKEVAEALALGKKPDAIQVELVKRGIKEGLGGNYSFYKDIMDRLYGQAVQRLKHDVDEENIGKLEELLRKIAEIPKKIKKEND